MKYCDLSLPSPAENLACDEALLELAEEEGAEEVLRVWQPMQYFVVVGYGNKVATEVNLEFCDRNTIPVLRRCTGGGTVLQGPGCLNYCLILRISESGPLRTISATNQYILQRHQTTLAALVQAPVQLCGHTDLAIGGLKFSGNSQRRRKEFLIFHGTFLLHMDIGFIEKTLAVPSNQPEYRLNRSHSDFLMNLRVPAGRIKEELTKAWSALEPLGHIPIERIHSLASQKYSRAEWNLKT